MPNEKVSRDAYDASGSVDVEWGPAMRPASGRRNRLETVVSVRFTSDEINRVRTAAHEAGESVSSLIREAVLSRCTPSPAGPQVFLSHFDAPTNFDQMGLTFVSSPLKSSDTGSHQITRLVATA